MTDQPGTLPPVRVLPAAEGAAHAFWTGGRSAQLMITRCSACEEYSHPPRRDCPRCGASVEPVAVSGAGSVFTFTVNHQQFNPAVPPPYVIGLIELPEQPGLRVIGNIVDCDPGTIYIGMPVQVQFEEQDTHSVPVFAPSAMSQ